MLKNTTVTYGWVAILLHWLSAVTILGLFCLGVWMRGLDYYDPWYKQGPDLHRSIGVLLVALTAIRLGWRAMNPTPTPEPAPAWQLKVALVVHYAFYLLLFLMLISGFLITTAKGQPLYVFEWFAIEPFFEGFDQQEDIAGKVHEILAYIIVTLAALHTAAALKHHFIDKDATLKKMLGK